MARRHPGMAADLYLHGRLEPAERIGRLRIVRGGHVEGGFGEVVFRRYRLKRRIVQPLAERHDRGRIAGEGRVGEGVDLDDGQAGHGQSFDLPIIMAMRPAPGQGRSAENGLARPRASSQPDAPGTGRPPDAEVARTPEPHETGKTITASRTTEKTP